MGAEPGTDEPGSLVGSLGWLGLEGSVSSPGPRVWLGIRGPGDGGTPRGVASIGNLGGFDDAPGGSVTSEGAGPGERVGG